MRSPSPAHGSVSPPRRWPEHTRADLYVGKLVDQFYLRKCIGRGGRGDVPVRARKLVLGPRGR